VDAGQPALSCPNHGTFEIGAYTGPSAGQTSAGDRGWRPASAVGVRRRGSGPLGLLAGRKEVIQ